MNTTHLTMEVRKKAVRAMLSGLLSSTLSLKELRDLGRVLDEKLVADLLAQLASCLSTAEREKVSSYESFDEEKKAESNYSLAEHIYLLAKEKKIGRDRIRRYITQIRPGFNFSSITESSTVKEIIFDFVDFVDEESAANLLRKVSGLIEEDPYLRGISHGARR